jgi:hypothetical protein
MDEVIGKHRQTGIINHPQNLHAVQRELSGKQVHTQLMHLGVNARWLAMVD